MTLSSLFHNPHWTGAAMLAKGVSAGAAALWALLVLAIPNATSPTAYRELISMLGEDLVAAVIGSLAVIVLARMAMHQRPNGVDTFIFVILTLCYLTLFGILIQHRPLQPTSVSMTGAFCGLSLFALISAPRHGTHSA